MNLAEAFAGHMVGGLAQVNVLLATLMAGMSGVVDRRGGNAVQRSSCRR